MKTLARTSALLLVIAVSSCASVPPAAEPEPAPSATQSASAEPSPEPTRPAATELALAPGSLNLLVLGGQVPDDDDPAAMIVFEPDACTAERNVEPGEPGAGLWTVVPEYRDEAGEPLFWVDVDDAGAITALQVARSSTIETTEGIGIGSTITELLAAYPTITGPTDSIVTRMYVVDEGEGRLVFEVSWGGGEPDYWAEGEVDRVLVMTTQDPSAPVFSIWGTDGGVGGCLG